MNNYAIVKDGTVVNIVVWDGRAAWAPPSGTNAVPIPADEFVTLGDTYNGVKFQSAGVPA